MKRRDFVASAAALAFAAPFSSAQASSHHKHVKVKGTLSNSDQKSLVESTFDCLKAGEACAAHCMRELAAGHVKMAECHQSVVNMLAAVGALNKIAHSNSLSKKALSAYAKACAEICRECAKSCEAHKDHHQECQACLKACEACAKVCDRIA